MEEIFLRYLKILFQNIMNARNETSRRSNLVVTNPKKRHLLSDEILCRDKKYDNGATGLLFIMPERLNSNSF